MKHKCNIKGCPEILTIDGGLKPHRLLCGAKLSGMRTFEAAGVTHFTGCTRHPLPDSHYCWEHKAGDSPVIPADSVSSRTRQQLSGARTVSSYAENQYYVVESITDIIKSSEKPQYRVKWVGFENETLEVEERLPTFITQYYRTNPDKLGQKLPDPVIKATKKVKV